MRALTLCTRFRTGAYEGDARLLVYDLADVSGSLIADDVRDLLDHRPNTRRIFVLAPFVPFANLLTVLRSGVALRRASVTPSGGELAAVGIELSDDRAVVFSKSFSLDESGGLVEEEAVDLPAELREGWLFDLFDANKGRVEAPAGVHFGKASDKHSTKFLRTSSVLLSTAACSVVAFFAFAATNGAPVRRIFVDTAPLLSIAFAMQRVALALGRWPVMPTARSFSSYGGVEQLPRLSTGDLLLISASTSGGLASRLVGLSADEKMLVTLFFLQSTSLSESRGAVLCDLTYEPGRTFGYPQIENFPARTCDLCKQGYVLAELEGDQFLLERRSVKRLRLVEKTQRPDARRTFEQLARRGVFKVRLHSQLARRSEVDLKVSDLLTGTEQLAAKVRRLLMRYAPLPACYVVLVNLSKETFAALADEAGLTDALRPATVVDGEEVSTLPPIPGGGVLVLIGVLDDHAVLRGINAQLRTKAPGGCVAYLAAANVCESVRNRDDLRVFLSFGEDGADTFTFRAAMDVMLPWVGDRPSSWSQELDLLHLLAAEPGKSLPPELEDRRQWLEGTAEADTHLFLPGLTGQLCVAADFVFLSTTGSNTNVTQADIYAIVSNLLATLRSDGVGLTESRNHGVPPLTWSQTVYGQVVLCPSNFRYYNDAVLRASLLRAASPAELNYAVDVDCSREMLDVLLADLESWGQGSGDALPEFILALACRRLRLTDAHLEKFLAAVREVRVPDYLAAFFDGGLGAGTH